MFQSSNKLFLRIKSNNENNINLDKFNIFNLSNIETGDILFNTNSSGIYEKDHILFSKEIEIRVEYVRFTLQDNTSENNFDIYVQSIPRDLRISLNTVAELLNENNLEKTNEIAIKREIIDSVNSKKFIINSLQEFEELMSDVISKLKSINESEFFIYKVKNLGQDISQFQPLNNYCKQFWEDIPDGKLLKENLEDIHNMPWINGFEPIHAVDPAIMNISRESKVSNISKNNKIQKGDSEKTTLNTFVNIPTGRGNISNGFTPIFSPLFGAEEFSAQMYLFEELNTNFFDGENKNINDNSDSSDIYSINDTLPSSNNENNDFPSKENLLNFLDSINKVGGNIGHKPTKVSNTIIKNPWANDIKNTFNFTEDEFNGGTAEGRPGGENGKHLVWDDNYKPTKITNTCITGAIINNGFRDKNQSHKYEFGEFGPNGLYHNTFESEGFTSIKGTTNNIPVKFHPKMPEQLQESLWTYDGTFPPKLLKARYEEAVICRIYNFLPINPEKNRGFGLHTISVHEHNGHTSSISDGFAQTYFFPGQYYDYLFPMKLSGYRTKNLSKSDFKAAGPADWLRDSDGNIIENNGKKLLKDPLFTEGDWRETMSTHWFHDHMLDFTARNVYKGNLAMMNYYSNLDRGNEEIDDGINLRFPSGTHLSWGNRDYDVNIVISDKAWDEDGQLWFNPFNKNGFLGDRNLVNFVYKPYFKVRSRRYRFRILNGSVSRWYKYSLIRKRNDLNGEFLGPIDINGLATWSYDLVNFHMIANDGNIMMHSINFNGTCGTEKGTVPTHAIAERYDIIIDFSKFNDGDKLYFINCLEHLNGKRPNRTINIGEILNGKYKKNKLPGFFDPCVEKFLEFRVVQYDGIDKSVDPSIYEYGKGRKMIPIKIITEDMIKSSVQRKFDFINHQTEDGLILSDEWAIETDNNGIAHQMDPRRVSAAPKLNSGELWHITNGGNSWAHNVHIHFTEGLILLRDNKLPPIWEQFSRKDVYRIGGAEGGDGSNDMWIYLNFEDDTGSYMMHCHNTMHEDHAMLLRWDIQENNCIEDGIPTHLPTWNGVLYMDTFGLPSFRSGINNTNEEYRNPKSILNTLKKIRRNIPQKNTGEIYVNGLGESLGNMLFKSPEGLTGFTRDPLGSGNRLFGNNKLGSITGGTIENQNTNITQENTNNNISCNSCNCNRELNLEINGTIQTGGWFDSDSNANLNLPKIVKFKPGEIVTIRATTTQEHGFILKQSGVGLLNNPEIINLTQDRFNFDNLKKIVTDFIEPSENNIIDILNKESIPNDTSIWTKPKRIEALTVFSDDIIDYGVSPELNKNSIGIPFISKANGIIAKFKIKDNAPETTGGTGGSGICTVHGTSMAFVFDICNSI